MMRKVALVSTFCDTQEKIETLKATLLNIQNLGLDSIIITPIELPFDVIKLATHCFVTKDNPLIDWPEYAAVSYIKFLENGKLLNIGIALPHYGFAGAWQIKKLSQIALTYEYERFYHLIYDLVFEDHVISALMSNDLICNVWRFSRTLSKASLHFMAFDRSNLKKLESAINREEYVDYLKKNSAHQAEEWFTSLTLSHLACTYEETPVTDSIEYYSDYDIYNFSEIDSVKVFIQKCNENRFDVKLLVYSFVGEKTVRVITNFGQTQVTDQSPILIDLTKESDEGLTCAILEVDGASMNLLPNIKKIGISYIEVE